jgi:hypothetical protein
MKGGMYHPLAKGYLNLSATRCYRVFNLIGNDEKEAFWTILHDEYAEKLGWIDHTAEDFDNGEVAEFCVNVCSATYAQHKRRSARAARGGLRGFFNRIFPHSEKI